MYRFRKEIAQIKGSSYIKAISTTFVVTLVRFQLFLTILSYVFLGNYMSVKKVMDAIKNKIK